MVWPPERTKMKIEEVMKEAEMGYKVFQGAVEGTRLAYIQHALKKMGYFVAPAAKKHHGAVAGGLFAHSTEVTMQLNNLKERLNLKFEQPDSVLVIGLLHDICKTQQYDLIADEKQECGYRIEYKNTLIPGHGEASLHILNMLEIENPQFWMTEEERMCIRFHMGAFADKEEWNYYSRAVQQYPNVLYTHTADMIASQIKGV